jgi:hypothetical protein
MRINYNFAFKNSKLTPWERPSPPNLLITDASLKKKISFIIDQTKLNKELIYPSLFILISSLGMQFLTFFPSRNIKNLENDHIQYQVVSQKLSNLESSKTRFRRKLKNIDKYFSQATPSYLFAFYLQNSVPKGVQLNSYAFSDNGFDIIATAFTLDALDEFITLIVESPLILKESVNINQINKKDLAKSNNSDPVPDFEIEIYGAIKKLEVAKRKDLYIESKASGLLQKLKRFNNLKLKLGS